MSVPKSDLAHFNPQDHETAAWLLTLAHADREQYELIREARWHLFAEDEGKQRTGAEARAWWLAQNGGAA